jgi:hypothetical protein
MMSGENLKINKAKKQRPLTRDLASGGLTFSAEISYRYSRPNAKPPERYLSFLGYGLRFGSKNKDK